MYDLTIPSMLRGLSVLSTYLDKAAAFVKEHNLAESEILNARHAPDMFTFTGQLQRASDKSKGGVARLTLVQAPSFMDDETTIEALKARVEKTAAFLKSIDRKSFDGSEERLVDIKFRSVSGKFRGDNYLTSLLLPDFYFHIATAHGLLRNKGLQIGKGDYFGRTEPNG